MELDELREEINKIDAELRILFEKRLQIAAQIAVLKKEHQLPIEDQNREIQVIKMHTEKVSYPKVQEAYLSWLKTTMEITKEWEKNFLLHFDEK